MSLTIRSSFEIAAPRERAWAVLTDIERAAPCFPGVTLTGRRDDGTWLGAFAVKLGPMSFKFSGTFAFVSTDADAGRAIVKANGTDAKGRGGAAAQVEMSLLALANAATRVELVSSVDLSGGVAQYGRGTGMIEALSQQMVDQFARNLQAAMAGDADPASPPPSPPASAASPATSSADGAGRPAEPAVRAIASPPAAPLNAGHLIWHTLLITLRRWFGLRRS